MIILLIILSVVILILIILGIIQFWTHITNFKRAKFLEQDKKYKDAIYYYAVTILTGPFWRNICSKKIKQLSREYGPFNFDEILEKELKEQGKAPVTECIESGHAETVKAINDIINKST